MDYFTVILSRIPHEDQPFSALSFRLGRFKRDMINPDRIFRLHRVDEKFNIVYINKEEIMSRIKWTIGLMFLLMGNFMLYSQEIDLIELAARAGWQNHSGMSVTFGVGGENAGTAKYEKKAVLEDGKTYPRVLFTHPQWEKSGYIIGEIKDITIPAQGAKLVIEGGFMQGAKGSDGVTFSVNFTGGDPQVLNTRMRALRGGLHPKYGNSLCMIEAKYDGKIDRRECDLSDVAGKKGTIYIAVGAGNTADKDWAVWTTAKITGGSGAGIARKIEHRLRSTLSGHTRKVHSIRFSRDSRYVVTAAEDKTARTWMIPGGKHVQTIRVQSSPNVFDADFGPGGRRLAVAAARAARTWDLSTGKPIQSFSGHAKDITSISYCPKGTNILTSSKDGTVRKWQVGNGKLLLTVKGGNGPVHSAVFSPDGKQFATASDGGEVALWNAADGRKIRGFRGHTRKVFTVNFSRNGRYLVSAGADNTARIWEVKSGRQVKTLDRNAFFTAAFHPNGKYIVTGNNVGAVTIWDVGTGERILKIQHSSSPVRAARFSPSGHYIVTAGDDKTAKIWEVKIK